MKPLITIELDSSEVRRCREFAKDSVDTHKDEYKRRGQENLDAIKYQIATGKMAELAFQKYIENNTEFEELIPIDFEMYDKKRKSFDADLKIVTKQNDYLRFHIKSITEDSASRYGVSWLFQKNDPLVASPREEDILVLCLVRDTEIDILQIKDAQGIEYDTPKKPVLRKTKVALYL